MNLDIMLPLDPIKKKKLALTYNNQVVPNKGYVCSIVILSIQFTLSCCCQTNKQAAAYGCF